VIFAFSTSSPVASVAVFANNGQLLFAGSRPSEMKASEVCLSLIAESGFDVGTGTLFLADIGPGSFTGTRVGVMIAKSLAYVAGGKCAGASAFDLISPSKTVVLPSRKGEWFIRTVGADPFRDNNLPPEQFVGFGGDLPDQSYPSASNFGELLDLLEVVSPEVFVPAYLIEPSISIQKKNIGVAGVPQ
jgi:tRNA threonylcarbamoyladenosine biosynthesis protein TsaB